MRTVTGPDGRRYSVTDTPVHSFRYGPATARRNTIAVVSNEHAVADQSSFQAHPTNYYKTTKETAPAYKKGGAMSKVVRGVKNITKGYSSVQVKVRNGMLVMLQGARIYLTHCSDLQRSVGSDWDGYE